MKKRLLVALATGLILVGMGGVAQALTMTEVVQVDDFIAKADLGNSGYATELDWVNKVVFGNNYLVSGVSYYTSMEKTATDEGAGWVAIDDSNSATNIYAWDFVTVQPEYFFIKVGNTATGTHFLYKNLTSFNYGVVDLKEQGIEIKNIGKFSHIGEMGTALVPEPTTMMLFGAGLAGLAAVGRRKKDA